MPPEISKIKAITCLQDLYNAHQVWWCKPNELIYYSTTVVPISSHIPGESLPHTAACNYVPDEKGF